MKLCEAAYTANHVIEIPKFEVWKIVSGFTHRHRAPAKYDPFRPFIFDINEIMRSIRIEELHTGNLECHTTIERKLLDLYFEDNKAGGTADPDWAWRPGLFWYYCELCETLFWIHGEPCLNPVFPITYFPEHKVMNKLQPRVRRMMLGID